MESARSRRNTWTRRAFFRMGAALVPLWSSGCSMTSWFSSQSEKDELSLLEMPEFDPSNMVGDVASVWSAGMRPLKIESVALVTGLKGTGSDPPAGPQRQSLLDEMQTHDVPSPNKLLASPNNSLAIAVGHVPAAARKGMRFDIEVITPQRSETTSLRGGWLMKTRMKPMEKLGGVIRTGHETALGEGEVLVDAVFKESEDKVLLKKGRVLGGGVCLIDRNLGMVIKNGYHSIAVSSLVGASINNRFFRDDHGAKVGVATPKRDNFIEIAVHHHYTRNLGRYMDVIRSIVLRENPSERLTRLQLLEKKLQERATAREAALQLEAIGREGVAALKTGLKSPQIEVRFYAAEALAYLDHAEGVSVLEKTAATYPEFRWEALMALATINHMSAYDALVNLLHVSSAETRYGAVRAIRERQTHDPLVRGETLGGSRSGGGFQFVVVKTNGEPLVHFAKSHAQEVVLFGAEMELNLSQPLFASPQIMIKPAGSGQVKIIRFQPGQEEVSETCSSQLAEIIPAMVRVGGNYSDVMQAMQEAKKHGDLPAKIAIDALPRPNREFHAEDYETEEERATAETEMELDRTFPAPSADAANDGFFGKLMQWMVPAQ